MSPDEFKRQLVLHYAEMARQPGAVDHARYQVKKLQRDYPQEFGDLGALVQKELQREAARVPPEAPGAARG